MNLEQALEAIELLNAELTKSRAWANCLEEENENLRSRDLAQEILDLKFEMAKLRSENLELKEQLLAPIKNGFIKGYGFFNMQVSHYLRIALFMVKEGISIDDYEIKIEPVLDSSEYRSKEWYQERGLLLLAPSAGVELKFCQDVHWNNGEQTKIRVLLEDTFIRAMMSTNKEVDESFYDTISLQFFSKKDYYNKLLREATEPTQVKFIFIPKKVK